MENDQQGQDDHPDCEEGGMSDLSHAGLDVLLGKGEVAGVGEDEDLLEIGRVGLLGLVGSDGRGGADLHR